MPVEPGLIHLLLIEKDETTRVAIQRMVMEASTGLRVVQADCLGSGLRLSALDCFDCALVGYQLPDGNALDFVRIGGGLVRFPVVIIADFDDERVALDALSQEAQDFLVKSQHEGRSIVRAVKCAIERHRLTEHQKRLLRAERQTLPDRFEVNGSTHVDDPLTRLLGGTESLRDQLSESELTLARVMQLVDRESASSVSIARALTDAGVAPLLEACLTKLGENLQVLSHLRRVVRELPSCGRIRSVPVAEPTKIATPAKAAAAAKVRSS